MRDSCPWLRTQALLIVLNAQFHAPRLGLATRIVRARALDVIHATRYYFSVTIKSFKCKVTEALFRGERVRRWVNVERPALRKLEQLDWSSVLEDLRIPPGNQLEALKGARKGQHSIRVNDQWRVCFVWTSEGPKDVEIVDYH